MASGVSSNNSYNSLAGEFAIKTAKNAEKTRSKPAEDSCFMNFSKDVFATFFSFDSRKA
jgi:hypothetical protein